MASAARNFDSYGFADEIRVNDAVRTGDSRHPLYRVVVISGDKAWLRDIQHGTDHIVPVARCHKI